MLHASTVAPGRPPRQVLVTARDVALFLRYYADLDYASIAAALGIKPGTVAATLSAAHAALRKELEAEPCSMQI